MSRNGSIGQNSVGRDPFLQGSRHPKRPLDKASARGDVWEPFGDTERNLELTYALALRLRLTLLENAHDTG